jgi:hypothetical protein
MKRSKDTIKKYQDFGYLGGGGNRVDPVPPPGRYWAGIALGTQSTSEKRRWHGSDAHCHTRIENEENESHSFDC